MLLDEIEADVGQLICNLWHAKLSRCSVGRILRSQVETDAKPNTDSFAIKESIAEGELVAQLLVDDLLATQLNFWRGKKGVLIDGYPRSLEQMQRFEEKVNCKLENLFREHDGIIEAIFVA